MMIRRYFARKVDSNERTESLAPSSMGNTLADRISVLVAFLVMLTMMIVLLLQANEIQLSPKALLTTAEHLIGLDLDVMQLAVDELRK